MITYTVYAKNSFYEQQLTAKQMGGKNTSKKIAEENNWGPYAIEFFRSPDNCRGEIDI